MNRSISRPSLALLVLLTITLVLAAACGDSSDPGGFAPPDTATPAAAPAPTADPQATESPQAGESAAPMANPHADTVPIPQPPAELSSAAALTWDTPESWTEVPPTSRMRRAQFRVPGDAGDGECIVFYFGPGQGGDATANARRWIAQFQTPDGGPVDSSAITSERMVGSIPVMLVEATGTYVGGMGSPMGGGEPQTDHMLLAAIAQGADANWFFKVLGPRATVEANRDEFNSLIDSLK